MQRVEQRRDLIDALNRLFDAAHIAETAARLQHLLPSIDALEIVYRLGLLSFVPAHSFLRYREVVGIPPLNMQVLTAAFHSALMGRPKPVPLVFDIVQGDVEAVEVSHMPDHIAVKLTRTTVDPEFTAS